MTLDKVQPLKLEDPSTGGTEVDQFPTELDAQEDYVECAGLVLNDPEHRDESTVLSRLADDMLFRDGNNPNPIPLNDLLTPSKHAALRQLTHFIHDGPAEGFPSGTYREVSGGLFPTSITWWESSEKTRKVVERTITWGTSPKLPIQDQWVMFAVDGLTSLITVTDTISYSGILEVYRTRTIA